MIPQPRTIHDPWNILPGGDAVVIGRDPSAPTGGARLHLPEAGKSGKRRTIGGHAYSAHVTCPTRPCARRCSAL